MLVWKSTANVQKFKIVKTYTLHKHHAIYLPVIKWRVPTTSRVSDQSTPASHLTAPELDAPLSEQDRAAIAAIVQSERPSDYLTTLHPRVNADYTPRFSPLITAELDRLAAGAPKPAGTGIDTSRYTADALEAPPRALPRAGAARAEALDRWRATLRQAKVSSTYLAGRNANLALLESYGRNAWLAQNWRREAVRARLEAELAEAVEAADALEEERRGAQAAAAAEAALLDESWRKGVGGLVEVQLATEELRGRVLRARGEAAAADAR
jgi:pre-mRNA-splicing factor SPF27